MASTSAEMDKPDPVVLGVSVPLNVTLTAVKQVAEAWQRFGTDFAQALAQVRNQRSGAKSASSGTRDNQGITESSVASAAGVSA